MENKITNINVEINEIKKRTTPQCFLELSTESLNNNWAPGQKYVASLYQTEEKYQDNS